MRNLYFLFILLSLTGCFKPILYLQNKPNYPVDVFYDNQRPDRPFAALQDLEVKGRASFNPTAVGKSADA